MNRESKSTAQFIPGLVALAVAAFVFIVDFQDVSSWVAGVESDFAFGTVGIGLWVIAAGVIVGAVGIVGAPRVAGDDAQEDDAESGDVPEDDSGST